MTRKLLCAAALAAALAALSSAAALAGRPLTGPMENVVAHQVTNPQAPNYPCETLYFPSSEAALLWLDAHDDDVMGECPPVEPPPVVIPPVKPAAPALPNTDVVWVCMGDTGRLLGDLRQYYDKGQWFNNSHPTQNVQPLPAGTVLATMGVGPKFSAGKGYSPTCDGGGVPTGRIVDITDRTDFTPQERMTTKVIVYVEKSFAA